MAKRFSRFEQGSLSRKRTCRKDRCVGVCVPVVYNKFLFKIIYWVMLSESELQLLLLPSFTQTWNLAWSIGAHGGTKEKIRISKNYIKIISYKSSQAFQ